MTKAELLQAYAEGKRDFNGADLSGADLSWANLSGADLREANLSGAKGLLDPAEWIKQNFEADSGGVSVYKVIGDTSYMPPGRWVIEHGSVLTEVCNPDRGYDCACGVNFGTREWCKRNYPGGTLWRCHIEWLDLAGVVVPYMTDGKARCARLVLIEPVTNEEAPGA